MMSLLRFIRWLVANGVAGLGLQSQYTFERVDNARIDITSEDRPGSRVRLYA